MEPCHSMNAGSVVGIPSGGADTQTLPYAKEFELFPLTGSGYSKTLGASTGGISSSYLFFILSYLFSCSSY